MVEEKGQNLRFEIRSKYDQGIDLGLNIFYVPGQKTIEEEELSFLTNIRAEVAVNTTNQRFPFDDIPQAVGVLSKILVDCPPENTWSVRDGFLKTFTQGGAVDNRIETNEFSIGDLGNFKVTGHNKI